MTKNPLWWLLEKSLINTGAAVLKGAEWWSEQEFFSNEDDERPKDDEDEPEEEDDVEDEEHEYEEDDVEDEDSEEDDDSWDEEPSDDVGLRARDQEWCDYDGPEEPTTLKIPDERADKPDEEVQRNEKSLTERAAGWGARKLENAVNRLAMSGLRFITDTDWDDDPELELSYPSELWCKPPHDPDDDWEEPDDYDEPRPERNYDSVYDLITPPGCGEHGDYEDRDLENEGWEEDDEDED